MFDMAGFVQAHGVFGEAFDTFFWKNEAMIGGLPGNSFAFVEFEEGSGVFKRAALALGAVRLDVAERVEALLELARKTLALDAEVGKEAMRVNDVEGDFPIGRVILVGGLVGGLGSGAGEHFRFEARDAVEAPGGVDEFLDELRFGGSGGLVFDEEAAAMFLVGGGVFGGEDGRSGG